MKNLRDGRRLKGEAGAISRIDLINPQKNDNNEVKPAGVCVWKADACVLKVR